jgi:predicted amidohydrolase
VVIGMVQLQLPVVRTKNDLDAQTEKVCRLVQKARESMPTMDLVVFPEYALHGLSMDTNPEIMCSMEGPEVAAFKAVCAEQKIWGCFSLMELNPDELGHHHRRRGRASPLLPKAPPLGPGRALGAGRSRHPGLRRAERLDAGTDHLP